MIKNGQCNILPDRPCNGPGIIVAIVRSRSTLPHDLHKNTPNFQSINGHVYWNPWNHDGDDDSGESIGDDDDSGGNGRDNDSKFTWSNSDALMCPEKEEDYYL